MSNLAVPVTTESRCPCGDVDPTKYRPSGSSIRSGSVSSGVRTSFIPIVVGGPTDF